MTYVLYNETMKHNPANPKWANRDRFVLSAGHGSMLQYSIMHLTGYKSVSVSRIHPRMPPIAPPDAPRNGFLRGPRATSASPPRRDRNPGIAPEDQIITATIQHIPRSWRARSLY